MILQIKAAVYRYTGVYLAYREQCDYMESKEFWEALRELSRDEDSPELSDAENAAGMLIGLWQAGHGFHRGVWLQHWLRESFVTSVIGWFVVGYRSLRWDMKRCQLGCKKVLKKLLTKKSKRPRRSGKRF